MLFIIYKFMIIICISIIIIIIVYTKSMSTISFEPGVICPWRENFSLRPGSWSFLSYTTVIIMDAKTAATKAGLEESTQSSLHRIRITLTSTKTKALEQGNFRLNELIIELILSLTSILLNIL